MDVVVKGRHLEVSERFREHVEEKLARVEKYDHRIIRVDVEVTQEPSARVADQSVRVQITLHSRGPVIRAEATAEDKMSALDKAVAKLAAQERKAADRKRIHHGSRPPMSLAQAMANVEPEDVPSEPEPDDGLEHKEGPLTVMGDGPLVVREKTHPADPMTLDQALNQMELVGHDFFLYMDEEAGRPAVVYRRKGYDYGVIRLGG